ncbi:MAG TPA: serine hydrolase domain-containing protein [Streptosporangiaceae bacterium]|nr:serine hydrolase domain-containing protein [Streptosporangiaceae bacterium]
MKIDPAGAGLDERQLERITEHLQTRYIDADRIAGCQVVVARHGQVGYFRSFGQRDIERRVPVEDDTIWRIYSMTKPITGVALMTLYERGTFQLTDRVTRFIPQWRDLKVREKTADGSERLVEPSQPMTVRDLLTHMSGLGFGGGPTLAELFSPDRARLGGGLSPGSRRGRDATLATMVDRYANYPLEFHPGTHWSYTVSTDVCARLVEIISGQRFDDYLREAIFTPLGMADTAFWVPEAKAGRLAACYLRGQDKKLVLIDDPQTSGYLREPSFLSGGGGLVSTTGDYLRFCEMLRNGGALEGARVLGRKTIELMRSNHLPGDGDLASVALSGGYGEVGFNGTGFGLTVAVAKAPAVTGVIGSAGEYMWGGAASTIFWIDPVEDLVVIFMTQLLPSGTFNFRSQLKALVYPAIAD